MEDVRAVAVLDYHNRDLPITPGETLVITLTTGRQLRVELFERQPGVIVIDTSDALVLRPCASNKVAISVTDDF